MNSDSDDSNTESGEDEAGDVSAESEQDSDDNEKVVSAKKSGDKTERDLAIEERNKERLQTIREALEGKIIRKGCNPQTPLLEPNPLYIRHWYGYFIRGLGHQVRVSRGTKRYHWQGINARSNA